MIRITYIVTLLLLAVAVSAQKKDKFLAEGNRQFAEKQFADAEASYRKSQHAHRGKVDGTYNLGNTIYGLNLPEEAGYVYRRAAREAKTYTQKHKTWHNLGNTLMQEKKYEAAVNAYKQALINNPNDEETRYNYALARLYQKNNPENKGGGGNDKNKDKDKNKDQQKNKGNDQKKEGEGDQKKKDQNQQGDKDKGQPKNDKGEQPKPRPGGASKQRIENILNAINNEERKVQDKVKEQKVKARSVQPEKDW